MTTPPLHYKMGQNWYNPEQNLYHYHMQSYVISWLREKLDQSHLPLALRDTYFKCSFENIINLQVNASLECNGK